MENGSFEVHNTKIINDLGFYSINWVISLNQLSNFRNAWSGCQKTLSICAPLYRLSAFHFTDCKLFTLQIISISIINLQLGSHTTQLMVWFANPSNHQKKPQLCLGFHWIAGRGRNIRTRFFLRYSVKQSRQICDFPYCHFDDFVEFFTHEKLFGFFTCNPCLV